MGAGCRWASPSARSCAAGPCAGPRSPWRSWTRRSPSHRGILIGATLPQGAAWVIGTAIGVFGGAVFGDPQTFGLDAMFPAFFAFLLAGEARGRLPVAAAVGGGLIALSLMPFAPPGMP